MYSQHICGNAWKVFKSFDVAMAPHTHVNTVDHEIFVDDLFQQKLNTQNILCNIRRPIAILVTKVW